MIELWNEEWKLWKRNVKLLPEIINENFEVTVIDTFDIEIENVLGYLPLENSMWQPNGELKNGLNGFWWIDKGNFGKWGYHSECYRQ